MLTHPHLSRSAQRDMARRRANPDFVTDRLGAAAGIPTTPRSETSGSDTDTSTTALFVHTPAEKIIAATKAKVRRSQQPAEAYAYMGILRAPTFFPPKRPPIHKPQRIIVGFEVSRSCSPASTDQDSDGGHDHSL